MYWLYMRIIRGRPHSYLSQFAKQYTSFHCWTFINHHPVINFQSDSLKFYCNLNSSWALFIIKTVIKLEINPLCPVRFHVLYMDYCNWNASNSSKKNCLLLFSIEEVICFQIGAFSALSSNYFIKLGVNFNLSLIFLLLFPYQGLREIILLQAKLSGFWNVISLPWSWRVLLLPLVTCCSFACKFMQFCQAQPFCSLLSINISDVLHEFFLDISKNVPCSPQLDYSLPNLWLRRMVYTN